MDHPGNWIIPACRLCEHNADQSNTFTCRHSNGSTSSGNAYQAQNPTPYGYTQAGNKPGTRYFTHPGNSPVYPGFTSWQPHSIRAGSNDERQDQDRFHHHDGEP